MFGTYKPEDVTILLKDITGLVEPQTTEEREREIQKGRHYCEMLPIEYEPSVEYMKTFDAALERYSGITADAVGRVSQKIWKQKGAGVVLVSLARAGTSIGILIKNYIKFMYGKSVPHYTISIIRGKGIDKNAMKYILSKHRGQDIQFIDGWTGKGAIQNELKKAIEDYEGVNPGLAVLSDPAYVSSICGTHDDFLIASSCLNSTVSGLLSRTFLRNDIIGETDYHGVVFYESLMKNDMTYRFIDSIQERFDFCEMEEERLEKTDKASLVEIKEIADQFAVKDLNLIKPSIGEATRVLLRRLPWKILVHSVTDEEHLGHLYQLADEKGVEVVPFPLKHYRACGIIKSLSDA